MMLKINSIANSYWKNWLPKDIANTVIFLASDEAEYITGQTITVDGGRIIN